MGFLFLDVSRGQHTIRHNNVLFSIKSRTFVEKQSQVQRYREASCGSGNSKGPGRGGRDVLRDHVCPTGP